MASERQLAEVRFLTVAEVAAIMRVSKMTVYRLVHGGELPAVRVGRSFRVPEQAVHDYLQTSYVDTASSATWRPGAHRGSGWGLRTHGSARPVAVPTVSARIRGLRHQEAPQADGEEEAPQAAAQDASPAS